MNIENDALRALLAPLELDASCMRHIKILPPCKGRYTTWPSWVSTGAIRRLQDIGISHLWEHQGIAADLIYSGHNTVISTGTASGKSLSYQLPIITVLGNNPQATALYISPTKALGRNQLASANRLIHSLDCIAPILPAAYDGDTPENLRHLIRKQCRWVFTNPDTLHFSLVGKHNQWVSFFRHLQFIVVDECHYYRGAFGAHVGMILRRLLRLSSYYRLHIPALGDLPVTPTLVFTSATIANPASAASTLAGQPVNEVSHDTASHGKRSIIFWDSSQRQKPGDGNEESVYSAYDEAGRLLAEYVSHDARTLVFVSSRHAAEITALKAQEHLVNLAPNLVTKVASYRGGYLPEDRRKLEQDFIDGHLQGLTTTNALELGIDIPDLDVVIIVGFPGSIAGFWQQAGRAGRQGRKALIIFIARHDPLDTYLIHHPEALLESSVEHIVINPTNPHILGPHILCAAEELPLTSEDIQKLQAEKVISHLVRNRLLRFRADRYFPAPGIQPHREVNIRHYSAHQVIIVDHDTGQVLGDIDAQSASRIVHSGAVYLHQGQSYIVESYDFDQGIALVRLIECNYRTFAQESIDIHLIKLEQYLSQGLLGAGLGLIDVHSYVIGYTCRYFTGEIFDRVSLDLPAITLSTFAVMITVDLSYCDNNMITLERIPHALHTIKHLLLGLLPLITSCDRNDIGGLSLACGPSDLHQLPTIFIYDNYPYGAGFSQQGFLQINTWLKACLNTLLACPCHDGCPSCIQSPRCPQGNKSLDKSGAIQLLQLMIHSQL